MLKQPERESVWSFYNVLTLPDPQLQLTGLSADDLMLHLDVSFIISPMFVQEQR